MKAQLKKDKKLCVRCHVRRAHYRRHRIVRWKRGFDLCFQCHRSVVNSIRSSRLPVVNPQPLADVMLPLAA